MIQIMSKNGGILALAAFVSTAVVAITYNLTTARIAEQQQAQLNRQLNEVIPHALYDNNLLQSCALVTDPALGSNQPNTVYIATKNKQPVAFATEAIAPDGYNGAIKLLVAVNTNNQVLGVRTLQHNETPGLGDKIELAISDWILRLSNKDISGPDDKRWAVRKDGGNFDQFTGATITPRAVVNATKRAAWYLTTHQKMLAQQAHACQDNLKG